jgi:hypothetical protein
MFSRLICVVGKIPSFQLFFLGAFAQIQHFNTIILIMCRADTYRSDFDLRAIQIGDLPRIT